ncbi:hypothetical protein GF339_14415, partial [candidate division KSB3 bacterium]|nr:hypothetical protein [candidate division KSB3 bacterium]MBD3325777.1 hypothetical protein [candidate division KSB3 bacterium]
MKLGVAVLIGLVSFLAIGLAAAEAAERSAFRYAAPVEQAGQVDVPVRIPLPAEVMAATSRHFADLRMF